MGSRWCVVLVQVPSSSSGGSFSLWLGSHHSSRSTRSTGRKKKRKERPDSSRLRLLRLGLAGEGKLLLMSQARLLNKAKRAGLELQLLYFLSVAAVDDIQRRRRQLTDGENSLSQRCLDFRIIKVGFMPTIHLASGFTVVSSLSRPNDSG